MEMELSGNDVRIDQSWVEQMAWEEQTTDTRVASKFTESTDEVLYTRSWLKVIKSFVCVALLEGVTLWGFAGDTHNIPLYQSQFVQSVREGRSVRMGERQKNNIIQLLAARATTYCSDNIYYSSDATSFIDANAELSPVIEHACNKIHEYFAEASLRITVVNDLEENSSKLLLSIETTLQPDVAMERLYKFDQNWWLDVMPNTNNKLCIDVVFI